MKTLMVASGKGGSGKSTLCACTAAELAALGRRTLIIEADTGFRNLTFALGLGESTLFDLSDLLEGRCGPEDAVLSRPDLGVSIIPAAADTAWLPDEDALHGLVCGLEERGFDYLFFDCAPGYGLTQRAVAKECCTALLVSLPTAESARNCGRIVSDLAASGKRDCRLVINRIPRRLPDDCGVRDLDEVIDAAMAPLLGAVPEQKAAPLRTIGTDSPANRAFINIARRLDGRSIPLLPVFSR